MFLLLTLEFSHQTAPAVIHYSVCAQPRLIQNGLRECSSSWQNNRRSEAVRCSSVACVPSGPCSPWPALQKKKTHNVVKGETTFKSGTTTELNFLVVSSHNAPVSSKASKPACCCTPPPPPPTHPLPLLSTETFRSTRDTAVLCSCLFGERRLGEDGSKDVCLMLNNTATSFQGISLPVKRNPDWTEAS